MQETIPVLFEIENIKNCLFFKQTRRELELWDCRYIPLWVGRYLEVRCAGCNRTWVWVRPLKGVLLPLFRDTSL